MPSLFTLATVFETIAATGRTRSSELKLAFATLVALALWVPVSSAFAKERAPFDYRHDAAADATTPACLLMVSS